MTKRLLLIGGCGYIGSALFGHLKARDHQVDTLDMELRGNKINPDNRRMDYARLAASEIEPYDHILWFAGHASVGRSHDDPEGALRNNLADLFGLVQKLRPEQRFIYASTGSVYNGTPRPEGARETDGQAVPSNAYDISKFAFDQIMQVYGSNFAGLRLGTLAGPSPNRRNDIILNSMTKAALLEGKVHMANGAKRRSILGIHDICRAVTALVEVKNMESGLYNLASFTLTIREIGEQIASHFGVPMVEGPESHAYDYAICHDKFEQKLDFRFQDKIEILADEVAEQIKGETAA